MTAQVLRPRVAIIGGSCGYMVVPEVADRSATDDYGCGLERLLDVDVINGSVWFGLASDARARFERSLRPRQPAVVIVHCGFVDCQPAVLPTWLNRLMTRPEADLGSPRNRLVTAAGRRLWPPLRRWQRWAAARAGLRTWRLRPEDLAAELQRIIRFARHDGALVLLHDVAPAGLRLTHWIPGIAARIGVANGVLAQVVGEADDPGVRLVRSSSVVDALGSDVALPDGIHFSAPAHAAVAHLLAAEIGPWLESSGAITPLT